MFIRPAASSRGSAQEGSPSIGNGAASVRSSPSGPADGRDWPPASSAAHPSFLLALCVLPRPSKLSSFLNACVSAGFFAYRRAARASTRSSWAVPRKRRPGGDRKTVALLKGPRSAGLRSSSRASACGRGGYQERGPPAEASPLGPEERDLVSRASLRRAEALCVRHRPLRPRRDRGQTWLWLPP